MKKDGFCPFLGKDKLCDYKKNMEGYLSETCRSLEEK